MLTMVDTDIATLKDSAQGRLDAARERFPLLDHTIRMVQHYGAQQGSTLAGAVTYFAFLSFFPILALAFAVVGFIAHAYPQAQDTLVTALQDVLPGMIGDKDGQISLTSLQDAAGAAAGLGAITVLYSGLGWISGMRGALVAMFEKPQDERPNFVIGKLRDLLALGLIGLVLLLSVAISGVVASLSGRILDWLGLDSTLGWLVALISIVLGLMANMLLFFALFELLAQPEAPQRAIWSGALLGALGFEILKQLSRVLLASTAHQPAFQAFGIALILVVWIYYFSRVVMYAAAWAHTAPSARLPREKAAASEERRVRELERRAKVAEERREADRKGAAGTGFAAGAGVMLVLGAIGRRIRRR